MPNYLEIGEVGLGIARDRTPQLMMEASAILTREVTNILGSWHRDEQAAFARAYAFHVRAGA